MLTSTVARSFRRYLSFAKRPGSIPLSRIIGTRRAPPHPSRRRIARAHYGQAASASRHRDLPSADASCKRQNAVPGGANPREWPHGRRAGGQTLALQVASPKATFAGLRRARAPFVRLRAADSPDCRPATTELCAQDAPKRGDEA